MISATASTTQLQVRQHRLPPLPIPRVDFSWFPRGHNGLAKTDEGKWSCPFCLPGPPIASPETHVALNSKQDKWHARSGDSSFAAVDSLNQDERALIREGVQRKDMNFICSYGAIAYWWDLFNESRHVQTNKRFSHHEMAEMSAAQEKEYKLPWRMVFEILEKGETRNL